MENKDTTLKVVMSQLENMFEVFNDKWYEGKLQVPVIAVNHDSTNSCYGWCSTWKAWQREGTEGYYEINMCAEHLNRPLKEITATLLHEMVHLWNLQIGIQDTSRGNSYHNKRFKIEAEKRGLHVEKNDVYGWTVTTLNEEGQLMVDSLVDTKFDLYRTPITVAESVASKRKSSSRKYVCPYCDMSIRATKEVNLLCGECTSDNDLVRLELAEGEED